LGGSGNTVLRLTVIGTADAAGGILLATERYDENEPVNMGMGREIRISDAVLIAETDGFMGDVHWDCTKPNRQPRQVMASPLRLPVGPSSLRIIL